MILKDIENLTDAEKLALVKALQENVASSKARQVSEEAGQYAKLVVDAIKKIKNDLEERYAAISADITAKSASIKDGKDGLQGAKGEKGDTGLPGRNGLDGKDGKDGKDGADGVDGNGVVDARVDFDGSLIITLSTGQEINAGEVVPFDVAEKIKVIGNGGGTSQYVLDAIAALQTQINAIQGGLKYKGTWNASTNTPALASGVGTTNDYYVVSVAGTTNLDGITDWQPSDWAIFNGTVWQKIDQSNLVTSVNGLTGAVVIGAVPAGGTAGQVLSKVNGTDYNSQWIDNYATQVKLPVKNATGSTITKGSVVYISGATGANALISLAKADTDSTSATTIGILESTLNTGDQGLVVTTGTLTGLDTSAASEGDPVWLSGTVAGGKTYGIANKPNAPTHIVYLGVVTRSHAVNGEIQVMVNNGWELDELHNVSALSPTTGQTLVWNGATNLWEKNTVSLTVGVNGTLPVANGGTGNTTAQAEMNRVAQAVTSGQYLRGNGTNVVMSTIQTADVPTLNQNTTGSAGSLVTTGFSIVESGGKLLFKYGATTIASMSSTGVITSATNIVSNGTP